MRLRKCLVQQDFDELALLLFRRLKASGRREKADLAQDASRNFSWFLPAHDL